MAFIGCIYKGITVKKTFILLECEPGLIKQQVKEQVVLNGSGGKEKQRKEELQVRSSVFFLISGSRAPL